MNLSFIRSYLTDRKQRIRTSHTYSSYSDVTCRIPQGYILGRLLFNIDVFLFNSSFDIASYADDITSCISSPIKDLVKTELDICCTNLFKWFRENNMKSNRGKCHLLFASPKLFRINIEDLVVYNNTEERLLGVKIDSQLLFENHVSTLCKKAIQKVTFSFKNCKLYRPRKAEMLDDNIYSISI